MVHNIFHHTSKDSESNALVTGEQPVKPIHTRDKEIRLAEFTALRQEIERRSQIQFNLFVLQLTASGAVFSFALARSAGRSPFLLIIPISTFMLCAEYVDQIYGQRIVAKYIREELAVPGELQWESWLKRYFSVRRKYNKKEAAQFSEYRRFCASIVTFPLIAAGALVWAGWNVVWSVPRPAGYVWYLMAWIFDVVFTFLTSWMIWRVHP